MLGRTFTKNGWVTDPEDHIQMWDIQERGGDCEDRTGQRPNPWKEDDEKYMPYEWTCTHYIPHWVGRSCNEISWIASWEYPYHQYLLSSSHFYWVETMPCQRKRTSFYIWVLSCTEPVIWKVSTFCLVFLHSTADVYFYNFLFFNDTSRKHCWWTPTVQLNAFHKCAETIYNPCYKRHACSSCWIVIVRNTAMLLANNTHTLNLSLSVHRDLSVFWWLAL